MKASSFAARMLLCDNARRASLSRAPSQQGSHEYGFP
jgi:hypothetical protein